MWYEQLFSLKVQISSNALRERDRREHTDLYEDALIRKLHANAVQSNASFAEMKVKDKKMKFQIGCGASVNFLPRRLTQSAQCHPTLTNL